MTKFGDLLNEPVFKEDGTIRVKCKYRRSYSDVYNIFNCCTDPEFCPKRILGVDCNFYILEMDYIEYIKYNNIDTTIKVIR